MKRYRPLLWILNGLLLLSTYAPSAGMMAADLTGTKRKAASLATAEAEVLREKEAPFPEQMRAAAKALELWRQTGDREEISKAQRYLIDVTFVRGELALALDMANKALSSIEAGEHTQEEDPKIPLLALHSFITDTQGDYTSSVSTLSTTLQALENKNEPIWQQVYGRVLVALARAQGELGQYRERANTIARARQRLGQTAKNPVVISLLIAEAQHELGIGNLRTGINHFLEAVKLTKTHPEDADILDFIAEFSILLSTCPSETKKVGQAMANNPPPKASQKTIREGTKPLTTHELVLNARRRESWLMEEIHLRTEEHFATAAGEFKRSLMLLERRLEITRRMGARAAEAETLSSLATIHTIQGQPQIALEALNQSLAIQEQLHLRPKVIKTLRNIGELYQSLGASDTALLYFHKAGSEAKELGHQNDHELILTRLAGLERERQRFPEAVANLGETLLSASARGDCLSSTKTLIDLARTRLDAGELGKARKDALRAAAMADDLQFSEARWNYKAKALNLQAKILLLQNKSKQALQHANLALTTAKQMTFFPETKGPILDTIAESHIALGQTPEAIASYRQQRDLYNGLNLNPERAQSLYATAKLQRKQGDQNSALASINEAITVVESIRDQLADPELRTRLFAKYQDFYSFKIDLLLELEASQPGAGHAAEAFHTSERSRARTLLELLRDARADIRQGVDPYLLEQEKALKYRRIALDKRWKKAFSEAGGSGQLPQLQLERQQLLQKGELLRQNMRTSSPHYASLTDPQPLTLAQVQEQLLEPGTLLLQYALGPERSHLFVVSHTGLQVYSLPPASKIETMVQDLREPLTRNQNPEIIKARASDLSQLILKPAIATIAAHKRLILVPDGALHLVPFASLPLDGEPLVNRQQLLHLPSSSTLSILREKRTTSAAKRTPSIAILADPIFSVNDGRMEVIAAKSQASTRKKNTEGAPVDVAQITSLRAKESLQDCNNDPYYCRLKHTRDEAKEIQIAFPQGQTFVALDTEASRQLATAEVMYQYSYLHFATHGIYNVKEPSLSGLLFSRVDQQGNPQDGLLQLGDIFNLKLNADLVVLSACETGLGTEIKGEGLVGLTRGFLYAGSQRVIVSLWKVDDAATAAFMSSFYKTMLQQKLSPSQALRSAQQHLRTQKNWASPFYWGAFALQGEW